MSTATTTAAEIAKYIVENLKCCNKHMVRVWMKDVPYMEVVKALAYYDKEVVDAAKVFQSVLDSIVLSDGTKVLNVEVLALIHAIWDEEQAAYEEELKKAQLDQA